MICSGQLRSLTGCSRGMCCLLGAEEGEGNGTDTAVATLLVIRRTERIKLFIKDMDYAYQVQR